ncbi:outer membrane protein [Sphingomicrobium sediminis]|uniref:Porin family protein n=1 Tax=Sphingomicrobium sediminis TaxID=2950949 RepID=A0A9X2EJE0_9SPHN|nr:outer membrane beta-barrel protein [Sphingomicrobium sediminis]MCM8556684.1 porin family protein [Sphingomicrobium sediminis]
MKKIVLGAGVALASLIAASPAAAQLAPSGPRVELQVGYDEGRGEAVDPDTLEPFSYSEENVYAGIGLGYDFSLGVVALGVDLEVGANDFEDSYSFMDNGDFVEAFAENESDVYLGARVTVPVGTKLDLYAKVGVNRITDRLELVTDDGEDLIFSSFTSETDGIRVGAGGRYRIGGGAYIGAEYRYGNYENDLEKHQVVGSVGYQF